MKLTKKDRKNYLGLILSIVSVTLLSACGGDSKSKAPKKDQGPQLPQSVQDLTELNGSIESCQQKIAFGPIEEKELFVLKTNSHLSFWSYDQDADLYTKKVFRSVHYPQLSIDYFNSKTPENSFYEREQTFAFDNNSKASLIGKILQLWNNDLRVSFTSTFETCSRTKQSMTCTTSSLVSPSPRLLYNCQKLE